jgi:hypothetical protein
MVNGRRGANRLGCLFGLLLLVTALYFGVNVGEVYLRAYRLQDAMEQEARFARNHDDDAIRLRLMALADSLGIPESARHFQVTRSANLIRISTEYTEHVELPLGVRAIHFQPRVEHNY